MRDDFQIPGLGGLARPFTIEAAPPRGLRNARFWRSGVARFAILEAWEGLPPRAATRLLDEPFADAVFNVLLGKDAIPARVF